MDDGSAIDLPSEALHQQRGEQKRITRITMDKFTRALLYVGSEASVVVGECTHDLEHPGRGWSYDRTLGQSEC